MTCHTSPKTTYANRPRTQADEIKTAKLFELPSAKVARTSYHRGLEMGRTLSAQAASRVRWTVRPSTADALTLGVGVGLLLGLFARPVPPLLALSLVCFAVGAGLIARIVLASKRRVS